MTAILAHLPVLQVVVPLMAAPLCVALRHARASWLVTLAVAWAALAGAVLLLARVLETGPLAYEIGGWAAPWGIEYRIDAINGFMVVVVAAIAAVVVPYARASVEDEIPDERIPFFYALFLLCLSGLNGIAVTGDAFNLFVFLEISSLSSYALIAMGRDRRALTAAYRYLVMGTLGATFYIIGVGMMYMMTGTLNMADLARLLPGVADTRTVLVALAFLTVGLSLKFALFPLHAWLPDAYAYAPVAVTVFLASTATKVAVYAFIRVDFTVFAGAPLLETFRIREMLIGLSVAAMFVASAVAIFQHDVKRLLAYSSVAQIGYIILGVSFATVTGLTAGIVHLFNHAVTKGALFMAVGCVLLRQGGVGIDAFAGMGRRMPWTMAGFVLAGLSLIGIPPSVGFVSKWYLILAALERDWWPLAILIVASSLLAVVYVWRVVEAAYFRDAPAGAGAEAPLSMLAPMWLLVAAAVWFGIDATGTLDVAGKAARMLLGGGR